MLRLPTMSDDTARSQGLGRSPTVFEARVCAMGAVSSALTTGGEQIGAVLRRASAKMIDDLGARIESGKVSRSNLTALRRTRPKGEAEIVSALRDRFVEVANNGRRHANEELARQTVLARQVASGAVSTFDLMFADTGGLPPDETPNMLPPGAKIPIDSAIAKEMADLLARAGGTEPAITVVITQLAGEARISSEIVIDELWARMQDEAIRAFNAAIRNGLDEAEALKAMEAALHALSTAKTDLVARQLAEVAYNAGRDVAAKEASVQGESQWVVRSELLDTRTCRTCWNLDGVYLKIGSVEYEQYSPPAKCEGGDSCRGIRVIVSNELAKVLDATDRANG
jgi:hypothetical protein